MKALVFFIRLGSSVFSFLPKSSGIGGPTCFLLFWGTFSFLFCGLQSHREPNTDLAWTLYITLFTCWAVSFILWRQATLLKPSPHSLPVFTEESSWTGCRIRRPTSQKPSAQSRQVESGISSRSMSVWVFVCLCPLCPAAALQIRRHHSLAGNSKTLSWVISNSCAHLDWG
jgi:hypothetical protein